MPDGWAGPGTDAERLQVSRAHLETIVAHARAELPNECCGVLAGRHGRVEWVRPVANADRSPYTYRMDPQELLRAYREADAEGLEVLGYYHSHPARTWCGPPTPSRCTSSCPWPLIHPRSGRTGSWMGATGSWS
ncbi:MAG: hypothetical protein C4303_01460 [candidate division GAL15 bacterium]